jgi:ATP-dependent DNA helicase RecG
MGRAWLDAMREISGSLQPELDALTGGGGGTAAAATTAGAPAQQHQPHHPLLFFFDLETDGRGKGRDILEMYFSVEADASARAHAAAAASHSTPPPARGFHSLARPLARVLDARGQEVHQIPERELFAPDTPPFSVAAMRLLRWVRDHCRHAQQQLYLQQVGAPEGAAPPSSSPPLLPPPTIAPIFVAHNGASFDAPRLGLWLSASGFTVPPTWRILDTLTLARSLREGSGGGGLYGGGGNGAVAPAPNGLMDLARELEVADALPAGGRAHRATYDVLALEQVYRVLAAAAASSSSASSASSSRSALARGALALGGCDPARAAALRALPMPAAADVVRLAERTGASWLVPWSSRSLAPGVGAVAAPVAAAAASTAAVPKPPPPPPPRQQQPLAAAAAPPPPPPPPATPPPPPPPPAPPSASSSSPPAIVTATALAADAAARPELEAADAALVARATAALRPSDLAFGGAAGTSEAALLAASWLPLTAAPADMPSHFTDRQRRLTAEAGFPTLLSLLLHAPRAVLSYAPSLRVGAAAADEGGAGDQQQLPPMLGSVDDSGGAAAATREGAAAAPDGDEAAAAAGADEAGGGDGRQLVALPARVLHVSAVRDFARGAYFTVLVEVPADRLDPPLAQPLARVTARGGRLAPEGPGGGGGGKGSGSKGGGSANGGNANGGGATATQGGAVVEVAMFQHGRFFFANKAMRGVQRVVADACAQGRPMLLRGRVRPSAPPPPSRLSPLGGGCGGNAASAAEHLPATFQAMAGAELVDLSPEDLVEVEAEGRRLREANRRRDALLLAAGIGGAAGGGGGGGGGAPTGAAAAAEAAAAATLAAEDAARERVMIPVYPARTPMAPADFAGTPGRPGAMARALDALDAAASSLASSAPAASATATSTADSDADRALRYSGAARQMQQLAAKQQQQQQQPPLGDADPDADPTEPLPRFVVEGEGLLGWRAALRAMHAPKSPAELEAGRRRVAFQEMFMVQLAQLLERHRLTSGGGGGGGDKAAPGAAPEAGTAAADSTAAAVRIADLSLVEEARSHLPFSLTRAQERALREVLRDMGATPGAGGDAPTAGARLLGAKAPKASGGGKKGSNGGGDSPDPSNNGAAMLRLLTGDVGSGKTAVALLSMLAAAGNGYQAALLCPTELLAEQHHRTLTGLLARMEEGRRNREAKAGSGAPAPSSTAKVPTCVLMTQGAMKGARERRLVRDSVARGSASLVVGTHALLHQPAWARLGLVVIDEQHRFGVKQRERLVRHASAGGGGGSVSASSTDEAGGDDNGSSSSAAAATTNPGIGPPHTLLMTATPIPRTLALAQYGAAVLSTIDELPPGRSPVETHVVPDDEKGGGEDSAAAAAAAGGAPPIAGGNGSSSSSQQYASRADVHRAVRRELDSEGRVYIVCPLVSETDAMEGVRAAEDEHRRLTEAGAFGPHRAALLHGKMPPEEKVRALAAFSSGETPVLIASTVVEVGIDCPEASVMVVEHADRFGLAQLHQLRGRVGRGQRRSTCFLMSPPTGTGAAERAAERLRVLERSHCGLDIAEADLKIRGPGDLFGTKQSGRAGVLSPVAIALLRADPSSMERARTAAGEVLARRALTPALKAALVAYGLWSAEGGGGAVVGAEEEEVGSVSEGGGGGGGGALASGVAGI